jgi:hypothetical protein
MELVEDRSRSLAAHPVPQGDERLVVVDLSFLHLAFDVIAQADPRQRLIGSCRVVGPRLVELAPRVHQASDLDDVARLVQAVAGRIGATGR